MGDNWVRGGGAECRVQANTVRVHALWLKPVCASLSTDLKIMGLAQVGKGVRVRGGWAVIQPKVGPKDPDSKLPPNAGRAVGVVLKLPTGKEVVCRYALPQTQGQNSNLIIQTCNRLLSRGALVQSRAATTQWVLKVGKDASQQWHPAI